MTATPIILRFWSTYRYPLWLTTWDPDTISRNLPGTIQVYDWETTSYHPLKDNWDNARAVNWLREVGYQPLAVRMVVNQFQEHGRGMFVLTLSKNGQQSVGKDCQ